MVSDQIEDAEILAEDAAESVTDTAEDVVESATDTVDAAEDTVTETADEVSTQETVSLDEATEETVDPVEEIIEETKTSEPEPMPEQVAPAAVEQKSGGFFPLLIGGLIAGGLGYAFAYFQNDDGSTDLADQLAAQEATIASLSEDMGSLVSVDALTELNDAIAANGSEIASFGERIDTGFLALEERIDVLERQPSADGTLQETAVAAFESDMTALRDQIAAQQEELSNLMVSTREEAQAIEESAIASARAATARASLAIIQGALETGAPFGPELGDSAGSIEEPVPAGLEAVAADGVATLATIQSAFPDAARAALATARSEGAAGEEGGGLGSFLRNQMDVRSVEPQEGDSVDAVLSRAEAAIKDGRLSEALSEADALPDVAGAALDEWRTMAEQRVNALEAARTLASQLNVN